MITHSRETYQPTSIMRWDRGIFNGSHVGEASRRSAGGGGGTSSSSLAPEGFRTTTAIPRESRLRDTRNADGSMVGVVAWHVTLACF